MILESQKLEISREAPLNTTAHRAKAGESGSGEPFRAEPEALGSHQGGDRVNQGHQGHATISAFTVFTATRSGSVTPI